MRSSPLTSPSIRRRLAVSMLGISVAAALMTAGLVRYVVGHEMDELMNQELSEAAEIIHNVLAVTPSGLDASPANVGDAEYEEHLVWQLIDRTTAQVLRRSHKAPTKPLKPLVSEGLSLTEDRQWRVISLSFKHDVDRILLVAQSERERSEAQNDAVIYTLVASLLMSFLSMLLMNWRMRQEFEPLNKLSQDVQSYDPLRANTAPPSANREELGPIERAIQELGQRLSQRITSERAFTSHAAHALRTPVAGIDVQLAMAIKEAPEQLRPRLQRAREASTRLGQVMQALLAMFRSGLEPQRRRVNLAELLAPLTFTSIVVEAPDDGAIQVDPDLLTAVLLNLLDNAQRHKATRVKLNVSHRAGCYRLQVKDDGEGCPSDKLDVLRSALVQQDYSSNSGLKGLGLVLADLVMRAHSGHVELPVVVAGFCVEMVWPEVSEH